MTLTPEAARALDRLKARLDDARSAYFETLIRASLYVEQRAREGDVEVADLAADIQRARDRLITENMNAVDLGVK